MDEMFPTSITDDERAAGFQVGQIKNPQGHYSSPWTSSPATIGAVVRDIGNGRRAVKMKDPSGAVRYAIWDANDRPVEDAATSLSELRQRYP